MRMKKFLISGFLAGLAIFAISFAVQFMVNMFLPFDVLKLGGMRSAQDPIMLLFFLQSWIVGFAMAWAYQFFEKGVAKGGCSKGATFGSVAFILYYVPSIWVVFTSMNYPLGFTLTQLVGGLLSSLAAGKIIVFFHK